MKKLALLLAMATVLHWNIGMAGDVYRWTDDKGTIFFSDSPPPYGSFKKERIEDQIDKTIEQKKEIDKRTDITDSDKLDQKLKIEMEYQKKAKSIRDYDAMREELEALREKYQKKFDELKRQWDRNFPGSLARHDIVDERDKLGREYENEVKRIKKLYGYY
jgi:hypothetical protein